MKHLILVIVLLVCFGCNSNKFSDSVDSGYIEVLDTSKLTTLPGYIPDPSSYVKTESEYITMEHYDLMPTENVIITSEENISKNHEAPQVSDVPMLFVYAPGEEPGPFWYIEIDEDNFSEPLFSIGKDLICSDNLFAKELVAKYKITSDTIKCERKEER